MLEIASNTMNSPRLHGIQMLGIPDEFNKQNLRNDSEPGVRNHKNLEEKVSHLLKADSLDELTDEESRKLEQLKKNDEEVKKHEHAHLAAAGSLRAGGPSYKYTIGPDGKRYASGGNVRIDTSEVPDDPEATIRKAEQIKRAALAPMDPSPQDQRVAAQASRMIAEARMKLAKQKSAGGELPDEQVFYSKDKLNSPNFDSKINILV